MKIGAFFCLNTAYWWRQRSMVELRRDTLPEDGYRPFDTGWDARHQGIHMSENPYAATNWKHYEWDKGWILTDETVEGAPETD